MSIATLAALDTATIHEAQGGIGALPSSIKPIHPMFRVCGPAFTVDCPPGDNLWIHRGLYAAEPGSVLVVDVRGATEAGYWGEVLSVAAGARGLGGLVIAGDVRDAAPLASLGFPVFATGVCMRGTTKQPGSEGALGASLRFPDAEVRPGDVVVGDLDGVVVVRSETVASVAEAARTRVEAERSIKRRLRAGASTLEVFGWE